VAYSENSGALLEVGRNLHGILNRVHLSFCALILASCFGRARVLTGVIRIATALLLVFFLKGFAPTLFTLAGLSGFHLIAPNFGFFRVGIAVLGAALLPTLWLLKFLVLVSTAALIVSGHLIGLSGI
jgi:hypothetical protein